MISDNVRDLELGKFRECPGDSGEVVVAVKQIGGTSAEGSGRVTVLEINSTSWTEVPKLLNRRAVSIQNNTNVNIKLNYSEPVGFEGMVIRANGGERAYDIGESVSMYLKSQSGTVNIEVEEVA